MSTLSRRFAVAAAGLTAALALGAAIAVPVFAEETTAATTPVDFTERDTGLFPDVQENAKYINQGNRGCNACHDDLFTVDKDNGTYTHITTYVGLKKGTYNGDCVACHSIAMPTTGNIMSENIHVAHYSSSVFVGVNGNCWSCHAMTYDENSQSTMVLYEDLLYSATLGGYPINATAVNMNWCVTRGWETGFMSGASVDQESTVVVALDQMTSAEENEFLIQNYLPEDGEGAYGTIDPETWTLTVTGVNNPGTVTLADLKALPQVELTSAQWCAVNGYNGAMVDNMPMTGVLLSDLIDAMGGLAEGVNALDMEAVDGWKPSINGVSIQDMIDAGTVIVLTNYGHDLTVPQGAPAKMFIPGTIGATTVKNLTEINFVQLDEPVRVGADVGLCPINSSWFDNDGVQGKVGEELILEGAGYGYSAGLLDCHPVALEFSLDYGMSWQTIEVPEDFDPDQWVHFTLAWTPTEAGTYIVKVRSVGANGDVQPTESSLIVVISE